MDGGRMERGEEGMEGRQMEGRADINDVQGKKKMAETKKEGNYSIGTDLGNGQTRSEEGGYREKERKKG